MSFGTANITEILWVIVCTAGEIYPYRIWRRMRREVRLIEADQRLSEPFLNEDAAEVGKNAREVLALFCIGVLGFGTLFLMAGILAMLVPSPSSNNSVTPVGILIVLALFGGVLFMDLLVYFANRRLNKE